MTDEFYTLEPCEELIGAIHNCEDSVKYLFNLPLNHADAKLRTPEMMEAYNDVAAACYEFMKAYNYYLKAENYLCADADAMCKHVEANVRNPVFLKKLKEPLF